MASCYGQQGMSPALIRRPQELGYLPLRTRLKDGTVVEVDVFRESEHKAGWALLNHELEDGRTWPFESTMTMQEFRAYFLTPAAFVVRSTAANDHESVPAGVLGAFYIKPNFPGRCAHICNGGFITHVAARNRGVGTVMAQAFLLLARDLGYRASYFNLVFATNTVSIHLWEKLGFRRLATVPKAARLRGYEAELVDAHMYYYDLTSYRGRGPPALNREDEEEEEETPLSFSPASFAAFWRNLYGSGGPVSQHGQRQRSHQYRAFLTGLSVGVGLAVSALAVVRRTRGIGGGGGRRGGGLGEGALM